MQIRIAKTEDLPAIMALYEQAKRYMKQTGNPKDCTDILTCPIRDGLSLAGQKPFVFLEVVGHQVKCFLREIESLRFFRDRQRH